MLTWNDLQMGRGRGIYFLVTSQFVPLKSRTQTYMSIMTEAPKKSVMAIIVGGVDWNGLPIGRRESHLTRKIEDTYQE
jgi:hypothetical protein